MTVLGWVDLRDFDSQGSGAESKRECDVFLFADGRISNGNLKLTDSAPKLNILEVRVHTTKKEVLKSEIVIGFAGSSALTALSAIGFVSHVLRHLRGEHPPNMKQIASFIFGAFRAAVEEYSNNRLEAAQAAIVIAGFDLETDMTVVEAVQLRVREGAYDIEPLPKIGSVTLLSGPENWDLPERIDDLLVSDEGAVSRGFVWNAISQIEESIRSLEGAQPYGGQLQICLVDSNGPKLAATKVWDFSHKADDLPTEWNEGDYRTTLLGFDVFDLRVGQCDFIVQEVVPLPDIQETKWAKNFIPSEPRHGDDGDFFSRPRRGIIVIPGYKEK